MLFPPLHLSKPSPYIFFPEKNSGSTAETYMKGRNCWNVNLPSAVEACYLFGVFPPPLPSLIPSSSVLFYECAGILVVWSLGISEHDSDWRGRKNWVKNRAPRGVTVRLALFFKSRSLLPVSLLPVPWSQLPCLSSPVTPPPPPAPVSLSPFSSLLSLLSFFLSLSVFRDQCNVFI